eukprot:scaffold119918_cov69-Phaeocystis_antarctica.AAC.2
MSGNRPVKAPMGRCKRWATPQPRLGGCSCTMPSMRKPDESASSPMPLRPEVLVNSFPRPSACIMCPIAWKMRCASIKSHTHVGG